MLEPPSSPAALRPTDNVPFRLATTLAIGYVLIQLVANLTVIKTVQLFPGLAIPAGSLLYALSFTWIDLINEYLGKARARWLVLVSISFNIATIIWFQIYINLPGTAAWTSDGANQAAVALIFGSVPRVYVASLLGAFIVENVDISIYAWVRSNVPHSPKWLRGALSNTVSAPLDGAVFGILAFAGQIDVSLLMTIIYTGAIYKLVVSYLSLPLLYIIHTRHLHREPADPEFQ